MLCAGGLLFFMQRYPQTLTFIMLVIFFALLTNADKNYIIIMTMILTTDSGKEGRL